MLQSSEMANVMKREPIRINLMSDSSWQHEGEVVATTDDDMGVQEAATQAMLTKSINEASPPEVPAPPAPAQPRRLRQRHPSPARALVQ